MIRPFTAAEPQCLRRTLLFHASPHHCAKRFAPFLLKKKTEKHIILSYYNQFTIKNQAIFSSYLVFGTCHKNETQSLGKTIVPLGAQNVFSFFRILFDV